MKYATLKAERDDAIAHAVEAERLSNKAVVDELEAKLEAAIARASRAETCERMLISLLASVCTWLESAPDFDMAPIQAAAAARKVSS